MTRYLVKWMAYKGSGYVGEEEVEALNLYDVRRIVRARGGGGIIIISMKAVRRIERGLQACGVI